MSELSPHIVHAALLLVMGCGAAPAHRATSGASTDASAVWSYDVELDASGTTLAVSVAFPPNALDEGGDLSVTEGAEPFVRNVNSSAGAVTERKGSWLAPGCSKGCSVSYSFALAEAIGRVRNDGIASGAQDTLQAPPGAWLLRPMASRDSDRFHLVVRTPRDRTFVTGMPRDAAGTWSGAARAIGRAPYSIFGRVRTHHVHAGDSVLTLSVGPPERAASDEAYAAWVTRSGRAVADVFGRFPMNGAMVGVLPGRGARVGFGRAFGGPLGGAILVDVGAAATEQTLREDWVLVHEMIHLGFPSLDRKHRWMEEGLATYLEPLVRTRAGLMAESELWNDFLSMMPNGLPTSSDQGLDGPLSWGRLYWGGALFCFIVDVEIRRQTGGNKSLDDALRAILAAGGDNSAIWPIDRAFATGDSATGVSVLQTTYAKWKSQAVPVDLARLFRDLGVTSSGNGVSYDERAPLAAIRKKMTSN